MIRSFSAGVSFLESRIPDTTGQVRVYNLYQITKLCHLLGDPHTKYPAIHIAGTSGKGSTAMFAQAILTYAGLHTGLHISPHLEDIRERMQIDGQLITKDEFIDIVNLLHKVATPAHFGNDLPTYFELLVAGAFLYFQKKRVDSAVIEVGLGGTLDATNVLEQGVVVITNISLDHTEILGKTVQKIFYDKIGIIKKGTGAVISGVQQPSLRKSLATYTGTLDVPLYLLNRDFSPHLQTLAAQGDFQIINFSIAYQAVKHFLHRYFPTKLPVLEMAAEKAAITTLIPGRFEIVNHKPLIILDGAHNNAKIRALVTSIKSHYLRRKWITVFGVKKDKSYKTMLSLLNRITHYFVFTRFAKIIDQGPSLSLPPHLVAQFTNVPHVSIDSSRQAFAQALRMSHTLGLPILITGSLYLVGEIRSMMHAPHKDK